MFLACICNLFCCAAQFFCIQKRLNVNLVADAIVSASACCFLLQKPAPSTLSWPFVVTVTPPYSRPCALQRCPETAVFAAWLWLCTLNFVLENMSGEPFLIVKTFPIHFQNSVQSASWKWSFSAESFELISERCFTVDYRLLFGRPAQMREIKRSAEFPESLWISLLTRPRSLSERLGKTSASPPSQKAASTLPQQHAKLEEANFFFFFFNSSSGTIWATCCVFTL